MRDTGPGIRQEELPHLFEPIAGESGTGLGWSIVNQIVELHGGHVSF